MFLRKLAAEANINCQETKEKNITGSHISAVLPVLQNTVYTVNVKFLE